MIDAYTYKKSILSNNSFTYNIEDPIVKQVVDKLVSRSQVGIKKYNTTLKDNDLTYKEWLTHLQEEMLDGANYIESLKDVIMDAQCVSNLVQDLPYEERKKVSDGYHNFDELYKHRYALFIELLNCNPDKAWKSKKHKDEKEQPMYEGWFVAGLSDTVSYHLPISYWDRLNVQEVPNAKWNGHNSNDVIKNLLDGNY
jgi:hypothetical protein